jgi:hypothetical protein
MTHGNVAFLDAICRPRPGYNQQGLTSLPFLVLLVDDE